jgi:ABC-type transport system involved in multi-copper enzyme maturation permease subunit
LFAGVWTTADCLSEEKREGTLGLLFLTDLKGHDVVLGKLAATSVHVFYGLLAVFPVMAIPLLAGGVAVEEFLRMAAAALNGLFFSLSAGMLSSAVCRDERKAMGLAFVVVIVFAVVIPITAGIVASSLPTPAARDQAIWLMTPSPTLACIAAFNAPFKSLPSQFLHPVSLAVVFSLSAAMLLSACLVTPRSWQERSVSSSGSAWQRWVRNWTFGSPAGRQRFRTRLLGINPFYWLTSREKNKPWVVWFFLLAIAALWLFWAIDWRTWQPNPFHWVRHGGNEPQEFLPLVFGLAGFLWKWQPFHFTRAFIGEESYIASALIAHTVLKMWVAVESARRVSADRRSGALELILCTPLKIRQVLGGQFLALERQFALPVLAVVGADVFFLLARRAEGLWVAMWACGIIILLADLVTLALVSLWQSLGARNSTRAAAAAVVRVMVLPWLVWALMMILLVAISITSRFRSGPDFGEEFPLALWFALSLVTDLYFGITAWAGLNGRFRERAAHRFERKRWRVVRDKPPPLPQA